MEPQTRQNNAWFELKGSAIEYERDGVPVRFVLLQRGSERGGAWLVNGLPVIFVPAGDC